MKVITGLYTGDATSNRLIATAGITPTVVLVHRRAIGLFFQYRIAESDTDESYPLRNNSSPNTTVVPYMGRTHTDAR